MNEQRLKGLMGLCVRAGQAVFGEDACRKTITAGQCGILLADGDMSRNTRERYERVCEVTGTEMAVLPAGLLEEATGRPGAAMAVKAPPIMIPTAISITLPRDINFLNSFQNDFISLQPILSVHQYGPSGCR